MNPESFILLVSIWTWGATGVHGFSAEFSSKESCEAAKVAHIQNMTTNFDSRIAYAVTCVRK